MGKRKLNSIEREILDDHFDKISLFVKKSIDGDIQASDTDWRELDKNIRKLLNQANRLNCKHHPLDRDIDGNENQYCTICGEITMTAEEIYSDYD
jgi:peptidoglycan hydrolase CwlO-like protein